MTTALIASDWYIIPVFPSGYDLKGLETLWKTVEKVKERYNPDLRLLGVLVGNFDSRPKLDADIQRMLAQKFGKDVVFSTLIHRSVKHREASIYGRTIFEHADGQQAAEQYQELAREVLARLVKAMNAAKPAQPELKG
jgi:chromosome partitioning protein